MANAKDQILANVRRSLNRREALPESIAQSLDARLAQPPRNVLPRFDGDLTERFVAKLEAVAATVVRVPALASVSQAVEGYLHRHDLANDLAYDVVMASDPLLEEMAWPEAMTIARRAAEGGDRVGITTAFSAVAETGTLVLVSSASHPTSINFLPENHLVVVRKRQIVRHLEDAWTRLREDLPEMPRTVNCITGPSRTGDVEQVIQLGAHGPRRLHVILVED